MDAEAVPERNSRQIQLPGANLAASTLGVTAQRKDDYNLGRFEPCPARPPSFVLLLSPCGIRPVGRERVRRGRDRFLRVPTLSWLPAWHALISSRATSSRLPLRIGPDPPPK